MTERLTSISIEPTSRCNLRCGMCFRHGKKAGPAAQQTADMDYELLKHIVCQYAALPYGGKYVHLHYYGEPLLYPRIVEACEYVVSKNISVGFTTNGMLLSKDVSIAMVSAGVSTITVSMDGLSAQVNDTLRTGSSADTVRQNVIDMAAIKGGATRLNLCFVYQDSNRHEWAAFYKYWLSVPGVDMVTAPILLDEHFRVVGLIWQLKEREACYLPFSYMAILADGSVYPCCRDYKYSNKMGNLRDNSMAEIWSGTEYQRLRTAHKEKRYSDIGICSDCEQWMVSPVGATGEDLGRICSYYGLDEPDRYVYEIYPRYINVTKRRS